MLPDWLLHNVDICFLQILSIMSLNIGSELFEQQLRQRIKINLIIH